MERSSGTEPVVAVTPTVSDPFGEEDDSLFCHIQLEGANDGEHSGAPKFEFCPPAKKMKLSEMGSPIPGSSKAVNDTNVFPTQDDSLMLQVVSQDLTKWTNEGNSLDDSNDGVLLMAGEELEGKEIGGVNNGVQLEAPSTLDAEEDDSLLARMADEGEKNLKVQVGDVEQDPFGEDDDEECNILCKIADEQEMKLSNEKCTNDPFESDSEDMLCEIADMLETVAEDDDGVPLQNRFVTGLGRPHPLLIPHILEKVLSHVPEDSPETIKSARLVCPQWHANLQEKASDALTLHNVSRLVNKFPYGLGYDGNMPLESPVITKIKICDPCVIFSKDEVTIYFQNYGSDIKWLGFDANLYCEQQWTFLRNVMDNWCPSLETLELTNVSDLSALITYSELTGNRRYTRRIRSYFLSKLVIKFDPVGATGHFHSSTVSRSTFSRRRYVFNRFGSARDGGLLAQILRNSPRLKDFTLHLLNCGVATCFAHARIFGTTFTLLKRLELITLGGHPFSPMDFRGLTNCNLNVTELIIGPIRSGIQTDQVHRFFESIARTLVSLELRGIEERGGRSQRQNILTFTLPILPLLKDLKITDMSRCRMGTLPEILTNLPSLEKVNFQFPEVRAQYRLGVMRYVNRMFAGNGGERHLCLKELKFTGEHAAVIQHETVHTMLERIAPQIRSLEISTSFIRLSSVPVYKRLEHLKELKIRVENGEMKDFSVLFQGNTKVLKVLVNDNICLRPYHLEGLESAIEIELEGFTILNSEVREIATSLAEKCCYTTFKNCCIAKSISQIASGRNLSNVRLCLLNLYVLLESDLREI